MAFNAFHKGFTMIETIITVAVAAILATLVMPTVVNFFQYYEGRGEEETLFEIRQALHDYAREWGSLPTEATWATDLADYTTLTVGQIQFDTWGRQRQYRVFTYDYLGLGIESFRGFEVSADYALLMSYGPDGEVDATTELTDGGAINDLVPVTPDLDLGPWPPDQFDAMDVYRNLAAGSNDRMLVFTNLPQVVENIGVTNSRITVISQAVENYAATMRVSDPASGVAVIPPVEMRSYRPPSTLTVTAAVSVAAAIPAVDDLDENYAQAVFDDIDVFVGALPLTNTRFNTTQIDDNARRASMIEFMRFLGLPDSYCCDATDLYDDDADPTTQPVGRAFYYYSNPLPFNATGCVDTRPAAATVNNKFLPLRVTRDRNQLPLGGNQQPDNCG